MTVSLRSLRVVADFDASGYQRGAQQKVAADESMTRSSRAVAAEMAAADAATADMSRNLSTLSSRFVAGYADAARFQKALRDIGTEASKGATPERVRALVEGAARKFGQGVTPEILRANRLESLAGSADDINRSLAGFQGVRQGQEQVARLNDEIARGSGLARYEMINLGRQAQDVAVSLAGGQSPLLVLLQQGSQIGDVFASSQGTVRGFFGQVASAITPVRALTAGVLGIGAAAAFSFNAWSDEQRELSRALVGTGRDAGLTLSRLNSVAAAVAASRGGSAGDARTTVAALAGTGRIGPEMLAPIAGARRDLAATLGIDAAEANKLLASSFADPVKGAEQLGEQLGSLNRSTRDYIRRLAETGQGQRAQQALMDAISPRLGRAEELTSAWAKAWDRVKTAAGGAMDAAGQGVDRFLASRSAEQVVLERIGAIQRGQRQAANDDVAGWRGSGYGMTGLFGGDATRRQEDATRRVNAELQLQLVTLNAIRVGQETIAIATERQAQAAAEVSRNRRTIDRGLATADAIGSPQTRIDREFQEALTRLGALRAASRLSFESRSTEEGIAEYQRLKREVEGAEAAVRRLSRGNGEGILDRRGNFLFDPTSPEDQARAMREALSAQQRMLSEADVRRAENEARTVAQRQRAAQLRAELERQSQGAAAGDPALAGATDARRNADIAREGAFRLTEAYRERRNAQRDALETLQAETGAMGGSMAAQERVRVAQQLMTEARREYRREYGDAARVPDAEAAAYLRMADAIGRARQEQAELRVLQDATFNRDTMFLVDSERNIATQMRSLYGDQWRSQMDGAIAQQLRFNDLLKQGTDIASSFGQTFASDIANGRSVVEALSNALKNLASRLLQIAMDQAIKGLLGALMGGLGGFGGGGGLLGSMFGGAIGGSTGTAILANGAPISSGRIIPFANGGAFSNSIVRRPTLFAMADGAGLMGEAGPEAVMPLRRDAFGRLGVSAYGGMRGGGSRTSISFGDTVLQINGSAGPEEIKQVRAELAEHRRQTAKMVQGIVSGEPARRRAFDTRAA